MNEKLLLNMNTPDNKDRKVLAQLDSTATEFCRIVAIISVQNICHGNFSN